MNAGKIRGFLLRNPKPAAVRLTVGDGEPQVIKPGRSFSKTAETIEAIGPELIECLDKDGQLLRAMRDDAEAQRSDAAPIPEALTKDPETARLTHFADLLHRAYMFSTEIAFNKLSDVLERVNDRSDSIEQRLERVEARNRQLLQEQVDSALDRADELVEKAAEESTGGDLLQNMASSFLAGKMQNSGKTAPSQTNGKGHA